MKKYTIGALFTPDFQHVLLIQKQKPDWQKGRLNFPGGKTELGESPRDCVSREFEEETGLNLPPAEWKEIGQIENAGHYTVDFCTAIYNEGRHGIATTKTDEVIMWVPVNPLPDTVISNLYWLVPFAENVLRQGNHDNLVFGHFQYSYE